MSRQWIVATTFMFLAGAGAFAQQQQTEIDQVKARQRISMMEGVLERAVSSGADNVVRQLRSVMGDAWMLTGVPEVRGFRLDGYGVFFDVEVPALRPPVTWPLRYMFRDNRETVAMVNELKSLMADSEPPQQERIARVLRQLEQQAQVPGALRSASRAGAAPGLQVGGQPDLGTYDDPEEAYTREVKAALVDAMIDSGLISVGPDEWLTVAARDNVPRDPLIPTDTADTQSIIFRIRGSDLAAFREKRLTLDEVRKKVETREN
jgi:hypothetical protein